MRLDIHELLNEVYHNRDKDHGVLRSWEFLGFGLTIRARNWHFEITLNDWSESLKQIEIYKAQVSLGDSSTEIGRQVSKEVRTALTLASLRVQEKLKAAVDAQVKVNTILMEVA